MAETATQPLVITQGDTWTVIFEWLDSKYMPVDITGCTACMQFRGGFRHPVALTLSSDVGGGLELGGANGRITAKIQDEQTSAMALQRGVYDLKINYPDGERHTVIQGTFELKQEVSVCR